MAIDYSAFKLPKGSSKLSRAIASKAARLDDATKLRQWAAAVKDRDRWVDRRTGQRVFRSLQLDPQRAEAHHIIDRAFLPLRYDVRNGLTLSLETHLAVELHQLRIVGTHWFRVGGVRYINGNFPVRFVEG